MANDLRRRRADARSKGRRRADPEPWAERGRRAGLFGLVILIPGLIATGYAVRALAGLVAALRARGAVVETDSSVLAAPLFGLFLVVLGALALSAWWAPRRSARLETAMAGAFLGAGALAILLAMAGDPIVRLTMRGSGYRLCGSWSGIKLTTHIWARRGTACPAPS